MKRLVLGLIPLLLLAGCAPAKTNQVVLIAHDSFAISDESIAQFQEQSGYQLEIIRAGDAGSLTNRLVLTKESPIADLVYGIDNTFRGIADSEGIIEGDLEAVDFADVCFNYDRYWFEENGITPPSDWKELTEERFKGLTVISNPLNSSPGLAFLATTVAAFGETGFVSFWEKLKENEVKVASSWEDAYFTEFSGSAGSGPYPIVLSYSSSPAAEIREDGKSQTVALLDDCFRQTEYVGVLTGASNPAGARELQEFLLGLEFQNSVAELMYVYPVNPNAKIPESWSEFGVPARSVIGENLDIEASRVSWQDTWLEIFE